MSSGTPAYFSLLIVVGIFVLLAVGIVLLARGFRGRVKLSEPHCAKCGYDLRGHLLAKSESRRCPECGNDISQPGGVNFGRSSRRLGLIFAGIGLLLLPVLLFLGMITQRSRVAFASGPMGNASKTNAQLLTDLKKTADQPWTWQELESRYKTNRLSDAEVATAIDQLMISINADRQRTGYAGPLPWSKNFLKTVNNSIATTQQTRLYQAYYGNAPKVEARGKMRAGTLLPFELKWGGPWDLDGVKFVAALREVKLEDGTKLAIKPSYDYSEIDPDRFSAAGNQSIEGRLTGLQPGQHVLSFICDGGIISDTQPLVGLNGKPGPKSRWIKPLQTWEATATLAVTVVPADQQVVTLVTDAAMDPAKAGAVSAPRLIVQRQRSNGVVINLQWGQTKAQPPIPVVTELKLHFPDGKDQQVGTYSKGQNWSSYSSQAYIVGWLDRKITTADVILTPSVADAEKMVNVDKIWGKPIKFMGVTLERYDLPDATQPAQ